VKTSVLIRILVIIVLLGAIGISLFAPTKRIEEVTGGQFHKATVIGALMVCILIMAFGPRCVHYLIGVEESEDEQEMELPAGVEKCELCSKAIGRNQTPYVVKEHIVCEECYKMIKDEKKKAAKDTTGS